MVVWTSLVRSVYHYDVETRDHGFSTNSGIVHVLPLVSMQFLGRRKEMQPLWELLSTTTICYIGNARCSSIFHQVRISPVEVVHNIWLDIINTLKGQWDGFIGDSDTKIA